MAKRSNYRTRHPYVWESGRYSKEEHLKALAENQQKLDRDIVGISALGYPIRREYVPPDSHSFRRRSGRKKKKPSRKRRPGWNQAVAEALNWQRDRELDRQFKHAIDKEGQ